MFLILSFQGVLPLREKLESEAQQSSRGALITVLGLAWVAEVQAKPYSYLLMEFPGSWQNFAFRSPQSFICHHSKGSLTQSSSRTQVLHWPGQLQSHNIPFSRMQLATSTRPTPFWTTNTTLGLPPGWIYTTHWPQPTAQADTTWRSSIALGMKKLLRFALKQHFQLFI